MIIWAKVQKIVYYSGNSLAYLSSNKSLFSLLTQSYFQFSGIFKLYGFLGDFDFETGVTRALN